MAAVEHDGSARVQQRLSDRWADYNRQGNGLKSRFRTRDDTWLFATLEFEVEFLSRGTPGIIMEGPTVIVSISVFNATTLVTF
jgi:hypothetical protein